MKNKDEILTKVREIFADLFEIEAERVQLDAKLYEDLDIDSIDAVDLVVQLKDVTGRKIDPEEFKSVRTVGDVVDAIQGMLESAERA